MSEADTASATTAKKGIRKQRVGKVVSDKMDKSNT